MSVEDCGACPIREASRRAFLRDVGLAVVGALALAVTAPVSALAESVTETNPLGIRGRQRLYDIPSRDSISVDVENDVIITRWQNRLYAFSLRCPHRGTRLEWHASEGRLFCPKHKARFQPDGTHDSGRRTRDLDRYDVSRAGASLVVDLDAVRRADREPDAWRAAVLVVG